MATMLLGFSGSAHSKVTPAEAARLGMDAGMSWSCYDPTPEGLHCGSCDSCRLRSKGFADAGLADPTCYA